MLRVDILALYDREVAAPKDTMDDVLAQLDLLDCRWLGPASTDSIAVAANSIGCIMPGQLAALYRHHDGAEPAADCLPWRLMSLDEVVELHVEVPKRWDDPDEALAWRSLGVRAFWTNDGSDFAGVFVDGPLVGCVCFLDHEDLDLSPRHRSVESFLQTMMTAAGSEIHELDLPTDWPSDAHMEADRALSASLEAAMASAAADEWARMHHGLGAMTVLPLADSGQLLEFLEDEDMYVSARAADEIGRRRYTPAASALARIAERRRGNERSASIVALGKLGTPEALSELLRLTKIVEKGNAPLLGGALRDCGCKAEFDRRARWRYQLPGSTEWIPLG